MPVNEAEAPNRTAAGGTPANGDAPSEPSPFKAPVVALPKGGGAIRGMGEKFAANPVTGTGSMSVPLATSPGRAGFGPQLSLAYDSGAGNGPFGFGWSLSLPQIGRKTDKGLPRYDDAAESDVFLLSGAEDLVPIPGPDDTTSAPGYRIRRYRPRVEGLFARIERWTKADEPNAGDTHWRSISKDNILTLYGRDENSRIADPADPSRVFTWLICETRDDRGNAVLYEYRPEDATGLLDEPRAHEANRGDEKDPRRWVNRYVKHIRYGNRRSLLVDGKRPSFLSQEQIDGARWMFEVVFDYGDHHPLAPKPKDYLEKDAAGSLVYPWPRRADPFSTYRAGFEVRTYRRCERVLMFHHFAEEVDVRADCLVRSTDFEYSHEQSPDAARDPIYSFLLSVTQTGYRRDGTGYLKRSLPPVAFEYTRPIVQSTIEEVDAASLENLPAGLNGGYQWTDLHGEGVPGILTEQGGAWFYKRNLSPTNFRQHNDVKHIEARFAPVELVAARPNLSLGGGAQFMDLTGDGQPDLVVFDGPLPGLYEHDDAESWEPFRPFSARLSRPLNDPNLRFVDLDGDGHADVLITEDDAFVWHSSLAEDGFGPAERVAQALDEERGPRLVFADGAQSIYLADLSGDGLTDLVRVRNGEVCYWPNLGYGRFGARVAMDNAPWFDNPDQFEQRRVRLADIDGSGTTDLIYLHRDGVRLYFNQSGNGWGAPQALNVFPHVDSLTDVVAVDLLGNGTACLVWSSPLPGDARRPMRYVNLMGDQKPHLLIRTVNNLGAETTVRYAPSTQFYLKDKEEGRPWITRLPFPVHVVERVETCDHVSRNRFVTTYAYHHGYFDGEEREFRGFGMVEQFDTEEFAGLSAGDSPCTGDNIDAASHVPPVLTKTWFHTGVYLGRDRVSRFFAGLLNDADKGEYYREPGLTEPQAAALLLDDTLLPDKLTLDEERQAARALKGMMLRQEVYALDGVGVDDDYPHGHPYTVVEQNFTVRPLQAQGDNRHAVFFAHPREALTYHYEREPADPRIQHALTLAVDDYGNVLKSVAVGYGRRLDAPDPALLPEDRRKQRLIHITATENVLTDAIDNVARHPGDYRTPLTAESSTYELRRPQQEASSAGPTVLYRFDTLAERVNQAGDGDHEIDYEDVHFDRAVQAAADDAAENEKYFRRLIERVRTLYRAEDLSGLRPLRDMGPLALPGESYKLALTPGLLTQVFRRDDQPLLPADAAQLAALLEGQGEDAGGYVALDGGWWIPSGRVFYQSDEVSAADELAEAQAHFFLPRRFRDPFGKETVLDYDRPADEALPRYDLLPTCVRDAAGNITRAANDYRVLQPRLLTDPNGNRTAAAFNALGLVVGTAVMGKASGPMEGDRLDDSFNADPTPAQIGDFMAQPRQPHPANAASQATPVVHELLGQATTRVIYDLDRWAREGRPVYAATLARETHVHALDGAPTEIQIGFSYSDGFGREIQKKIQAEPGRLVEGGPVVNPRWVGSGWTIFNNKGKPVRQYEPFFSGAHEFEFGVTAGVSPILFYDPTGRVVATLHPNHTFEKVVFDPWQQATYDVNDTVAARDHQTGDPRTDLDIGGYVAAYFETQPDGWQTWRARRQDGALGAAEQAAAAKTVLHANTPTTAHLDALGRPFLTIARNRFQREDANGILQTIEETYATRVELDIEGNQRAVRDADTKARDAAGAAVADPLGRVVMRYAYDMLGNRIHQTSMEAGRRWMLADATGKPIRAFDSRGFARRMTYDALRRPTDLRVSENGVDWRIAEHTVYGEGQGAAGNHRGRVYQVFDGAGVVTSDEYDFKGNLRRGRRDMLAGYKAVVDWVNPVVPPGSEPFPSSTTYDALNRPVTVTTPDGSIYRPRFNEANLLDRVEVNLEGAAAATPFVTNIDYNAKGQRTRIEYGSGAAPGQAGVTTTYDYDPLTFRLTALQTTRPAGVNGLGSLFVNATVVQDLLYTYDPVGNITRIEDAALRAVVHGGQTVAPVGDYTYDAVYRLIEAHGREHIGQTGHDFNLPPDGNYRDHPFFGRRANPNDPEALRTYIERYAYDEVGNFETMRHIAANGSWTRTYAYNETSLLEDGADDTLRKSSNRLSGTIVGNGLNHPEAYTHDPHGNMTRLPHLGGAAPADNLYWDFEDQLQQVDLLGGETAYYVYDAAGQRARKVIEGANGQPREERLYLGGYEVYRRRAGQHAGLERRTLHVMDDQQRIALVETRNGVNDGTPQQVIRYQLGNHLGSASVELAADAALISYEEYHPYGTTAFQAVRGDVEVAAKRYRYTGKERDEETGLNYHTARYYIPWLGRWCNTDPAGFVNGSNLYCYAINRPTSLLDKHGTDALDDTLDSLRAGTSAEADFLQSARSIEATFPPDLTNPERGYTSFMGGERILRRLSQLDRIAELRHVVASFDRVEEGEGGAAHLDRNLALAIAFRESSIAVLGRSDRRMDTFNAGGLDRLYGERTRLTRGGFLPEDVESRLLPGSTVRTEGSTAQVIRRAAAASIREEDLLTAYGAVVAERASRFEAVAQERGMETNGLSLRARRVWNALFFGGPGGLSYKSFSRQLPHHRNEEGWIASHFGAQTILDFLQTHGYTAEDITRLNEIAPDLYNMTRTKSAFIVAAEAEVLDQYLPDHNPLVGPDNFRVSVGAQ